MKTPPPTIAVYRRHSDKAPVALASLPEIIEEIRNGAYAPAVASIRAKHEEAARETDPEKRKQIAREKSELKAELPCVQVSASEAGIDPETKKGRRVFRHSGLVQIDLDHIGAEAARELQDGLEYDDHVAACFLSPSGDGLKVFLAVPAEIERHADSYEAAVAYIREKYGHGAAVDTSARDLARVCYLSHDPGAWHQPFKPLPVDTWLRPQELEVPTAPPEKKEADTPNPRGWIILPSGPVGNLESAKTAFNAMLRSGKFFLRGGAVCEVRTIEGADSIEIVRPAALCSACEDCGEPVASWRAVEDGKFALRPGAHVVERVAKMWLESSARFALPTIKSVVTCPPLHFDGENLVMLEPGYHEPSGTLVLGKVDVDPDMTLASVMESIDLLLREFDFVTPSDRARALAMLVTPALVAGGLLREHVPIFGVEADKSQSGKGYLCELVQAVYGELPSTIGRKEGGVGSFDESLASALIGGRPFIQIDNIRGRLASQFFEMVLTCARGATVGCRVPHRGEVHIDPSRVVFHVTSNGLEMTEDLANRACIVRIRKRERWNPPRFPQGGLIEHVAANRGRFLGAVYNLAARWVAEGRPRTEDTRAPGRFSPNKSPRGRPA